jgi:hypothetical protein
MPQACHEQCDVLQVEGDLWRHGRVVGARADPKGGVANVLEDENARLNRLLADAMLDNVVLKELASKNW